MGKKIFDMIAVIVVFLIIGVQSAYPQDNIPAVIDEILDLYRTHDVVLLGEQHARKLDSDFRLALIQHPKFAETVNDIVIECANSLYQELLDDYILKLKEVSDTDLKMIWRNTTITSQAWDSPIYEEFIRAVRKVNESLRPERRIRLIAGDPPIDWKTVTTGDEYNKYYSHRDETAYTAIEKEIIEKNRKALVIYGRLHFITPKDTKNTFLARAPNLFATKTIASYLKEKYPGKAYSILPLSERGDSLEEFKRITGIDKIPYLFKLAGMEHLNLKANNLFRIPFNEPASDMMDSILFFGSMPNEIVDPNPEVLKDTLYQKETERRRKIAEKGS